MRQRKTDARKKDDVYDEEQIQLVKYATATAFRPEPTQRLPISQLCVLTPLLDAGAMQAAHSTSSNNSNNHNSNYLEQQHTPAAQISLRAANRSSPGLWQLCSCCYHSWSTM